MRKLIILIILLIPLNVYGASIPELNSDKAIIYDLTTDEILLSLNSDEEASIASLTKIMTVITAIENIEDLEKELTITKNMLQGIYWNASRAGLKVGDVVTYKDLLYASLLPSGADATNVLALTISGTEKNYVKKMNALAESIGMDYTNFVNTSGLDTKNQYSTAKDVLKLLKYALKNDVFKEVYTTKEYTLTNGLKVESTVTKFNEKMALDTSRIIGSKTGFTGNAGYCLSSLISSNNHEVIIITLGAEKINNDFYHIIDTLNLIEYVDEELESKLVNEDININENIIIINKIKKITNYKNYKKIYLISGLLVLFVLLNVLCYKKAKVKK